MAGRLFLTSDQPWILWSWLSTHIQLFGDALVQHIELTVIAVVLALVIAVPLGIVAQRRPPLRNPILTTAGILYTIPSIALFAFLVPYTGIESFTTAEIGLVGYALLIILRNVVVGLESVPPDVIDAANGMGYRPLARLIQIELPLALPAIFAGVRVATVTTIGLVTVTALIGLGGLGQEILTGLVENFRTPLLVATLLSIALAFVADLTLAGAQRLAVPWARAR